MLQLLNPAGLVKARLQSAVVKTKHDKRLAEAPGAFLYKVAKIKNLRKKKKMKYEMCVSVYRYDNVAFFWNANFLFSFSRLCLHKFY